MSSWFSKFMGTDSINQNFDYNAAQSDYGGPNQYLTGAIGSLGQQALEQQQRQILETQSRERIFDPQQRAGFFSQIYSPLVGSFGPQSRYTVDTAPPPTPLQTITGIGGLGVGLLGGLGNLLGSG